jgi:hypothetical protein
MAEEILESVMALHFTYIAILLIFKVKILVFHFTREWRELHCGDLYDLYSPILFG